MPHASSQSKARRRLVVGLAAAALITPLSLVSAPAATAASCVSVDAITAFDPNQSQQFRKANSSCRDMNARYTRPADGSGVINPTVPIRGQYLSKGVWLGGSRGYVPVPVTDQGLVVLVSSLASGTMLRGELQRSNEKLQRTRYVV